MDLKAAVLSYQYAERAKSELIVCSQLIIALGSFPEQERAGGRRMLILVMESIRSEIEFARRATEKAEFGKSVGKISEAISLVESDQSGAASLRISEAITGSTNVAQEAWQVLSDNGLI